MNGVLTEGWRDVITQVPFDHVGETHRAIGIDLE